MKKEVLSQFGHGDLILLGFLLFFACFMGVLFWACRKSQKSHFDQLATIPLHRDSSLEEKHG